MRYLKILCWICLCVVALGCMGCNKKPINSDIEGHWILERFTLLNTDKVIECERLYFGITRVVGKVFEKQGSKGYGSFEALIEYAENERVLIFKDFKWLNNEGKVLDATPEQLHPFGINNPKRTEFRVLDSSHKHMVLESDYACLELKKF